MTSSFVANMCYLRDTYGWKVFDTFSKTGLFLLGLNDCRPYIEAKWFLLGLNYRPLTSESSSIGEREIQGMTKSASYAAPGLKHAHDAGEDYDDDDDDDDDDDEDEEE